MLAFFKSKTFVWHMRGFNTYLKNLINYIFATRKVWFIIWYVQILGAIFFGTFWISTNRVELRAGQMSMLSNDMDGCCLLYRYVRSLCSV